MLVRTASQSACGCDSFNNFNQFAGRGTGHRDNNPCITLSFAARAVALHHRHCSARRASVGLIQVPREAVGCVRIGDRAADDAAVRGR